MSERRTWLAGAWLALLLLGGLAPPGSLAPLGEEAEPPLAELRSLLEAKEYVEALASAEVALEWFPEHAELLDLASQAALESGDKDRALWYATLARAELPAESAQPGNAKPAPATVGVSAPAGGTDRPDFAAELERRIAFLDPLEDRGRTLVADYAGALFQLGRACAKRKLYVNAVDLLGRCQDLGRAEARAELGKIYDNKKAVEALVASGLDVPLAPKKPKGSAAKLAREDAKHSDWEDPWEVKGDNYTVRTDLPLETAERISLAMEQMNRFYRKVFHVKERGGDTARVALAVHKTYEQFKEVEQPGEGVAGFFVPNVNKVATYDPRSEGESLGELWSTLFHEASHQFTHLISADLIPSWLNEGTASYFEGARLLANGTVETNLVPEGRLLALEAEIRRGTPTLKQVVSYFEPGSYPGEYYAVGRGLVYFLQNYEDERCERVYRPLYLDYLAAYGSGGKHDPLERFVEYFVTRAKQPGSASFEDFERRWQEWIHALHGLYFGGPERADELVLRARKQREKKKSEAAIESYRWALRKRPGDVLASLELSDVLAERGEGDAALFHARAAFESARAFTDPEQRVPGPSELTAGALERDAGARIAKCDPEFAKAFAAADGLFLAGTQEAARAYAEKEFPLAALVLLDGARTLAGERAVLAQVRAKIAQDSGADTRRWRRVPAGADLAAWEAGAGWKADGEALVVESDGPSFCTLREEPPARFRFEVTLALEDFDEGDFAALTFGAGPSTLQYFGLAHMGEAAVLEIGALRDDWEPLDNAGFVAKKDFASLPIAIEVGEGEVEYFARGRSAAKHAYPPGELRGTIGLIVQGCRARFPDLRVKF